MNVHEFTSFLKKNCANKVFDGSKFGLDLWIKYDVGRRKFMIAGELFPPTYISRNELERSLTVITDLSDLIRDKRYEKEPQNGSST